MSKFTSPDAALAAWSLDDVKKFRVRVYQLASGYYEGFPGAAKIPEGAVEVPVQPRYPSDEDPREGTNQAMKKLQATHKDKIEKAKVVAMEIARKNLTVHSRALREELVKQGLLEENSGREHWLGAVFNELAREGKLKKTGQHYKYSDSARGIHERTVTLWAYNG